MSAQFASTLFCPFENAKLSNYQFTLCNNRALLSELHQEEHLWNLLRVSSFHLALSEDFKTILNSSARSTLKVVTFFFQ